MPLLCTKIWHFFPILNNIVIGWPHYQQYITVSQYIANTAQTMFFCVWKFWPEEELNSKLDYTVHLSSSAYISELTGPLLVRNKMKTLWSTGTLHDQLYLHVLSHRLPNLVNMALHCAQRLFFWDVFSTITRAGLVWTLRGCISRLCATGQHS